MENINLSISNVYEAQEALATLLSQRETLRSLIVDRDAISKRTNMQGTITNISKDSLFVNYECWVSIPIQIDLYDSLIDVDESVKESIVNFKNTFTQERKLKLLIQKLKKKESLNSVL